jgi:hypothetical protein
MNQSAYAGDAAIDLVAGQVQIRARISQGIAAAKVAAGVFRGFCLSLLKGADGSTRCARVALVDTPQLAKSSEGALLKLSRNRAMPSTDILVNSREVRLAVRQAKDRRAEEIRLSKASNPPPGGYARPAGEAQWQGTSTTAGGRGTDIAPPGRDEGEDTAMQAILRTLAAPFKESTGLITMLASRR